MNSMNVIINLPNQIIYNFIFKRYLKDFLLSLIQKHSS